jgi:hypothetical protein
MHHVGTDRIEFGSCHAGSDAVAHCGDHPATMVPALRIPSSSSAVLIDIPFSIQIDARVNTSSNSAANGGCTR